MKLVSVDNNFPAMGLIRKYSLERYTREVEHRTLYDTVYADNSVIFFTNAIGAHYPPPRMQQGSTSIVMCKTLADTNMECDGMLPPNLHFIVTSLEVEENCGNGYRLLNTRGYLTFLVGCVVLIGFPTDIGEDQMPTIYIPPQRNFCVTLGGELLRRDHINGIRYRCRLHGVMARVLQE